MKKYPLSERIRVAVRMLVMMQAVHVTVVFIYAVRNRIGGWIWFYTALQLFFLIAVSGFVKRYVKRPYEELEGLFRAFTEGRIYEELFASGIYLTPVWNEVMEQFHHLINKQDAIRMSRKQAEYLALQNQINPHFLYNTLEAIRGDALRAGIESVAETTEALSIYFRYTITQVDRLVTLEEEIDNIENYFTIQRYRFGEKLKLDIGWPADEADLRLKMPRLTLQPFAENAIFHGLEAKREGGTVQVNIETTQHRLLVTISDDGIGMEEEKVDEINNYLERVAVSYVGDDRRQGSIAMKNVNGRIKLMFGEEYGVRVYSTRGVGTDVFVTLPKLAGDEDEKRNSEN